MLREQAREARACFVSGDGLAGVAARTCWVGKSEVV